MKKHGHYENSKALSWSRFFSFIYSFRVSLISSLL